MKLHLSILTKRGPKPDQLLTNLTINQTQSIGINYRIYRILILDNYGEFCLMYKWGFSNIKEAITWLRKKRLPQLTTVLQEISILTVKASARLRVECQSTALVVALQTETGGQIC
jgi:hypothetical protein